MSKISDRDWYDLLAKLGFTKKEVALYLATIRYGSQSASFLAQKAGLNRSTTYDILKSLIQKNLVYQTVKGKITNFSPSPLDRLLDYTNKKSADFLDLKPLVKSVLPEIRKIQAQTTVTPASFRFFQGPAIQDLFDDVIDGVESGMFLLLCDSFPSEMITSYQQRRFAKISKNIKIHSILSENAKISKDCVIWEHEWRKMPAGPLAAQNSVILYNGNRVAFFSSREENFGLLVQSQDLHKFQKTLFDQLWSAADPR